MPSAICSSRVTAAVLRWAKPRAQTALGDNSKSASFDRLKDRVHHTEGVATAEVELLTDDVGDRLNRDAEVDRRLAGLKTRRGLLA